VVELASQRTQACFYVAKGIPVNHLGKGHRQILILARKASRAEIAAVARHTTANLAIRQEAQQLREIRVGLGSRPIVACPETRFSGPVAVQIAASQIIPAELSQTERLVSGPKVGSRTVVAEVQCLRFATAPNAINAAPIKIVPGSGVTV
jgi:hypothetical protein